jgi:hypothetical protein
MKKRTHNIILKKLFATATVALTLSACQPGAPIVKVLGEVGGFRLTENVMTLKSKNARDPFFVSGVCFGSVNSIQVSFDEGATYQPLNQFAQSFSQSCSSTGSYSYLIDPAIATQFNVPAGRSYKDFYFRGTSDFGMTSVQILRRQVNLGSFQITSGSGLVTSGTAVLSGRIISAAGVASGTNWVLKGALRIK